jgi:hypothetical protein
MLRCDYDRKSSDSGQDNGRSTVNNSSLRRYLFMSETCAVTILLQWEVYRFRTSIPQSSWVPPSY